MKPDGKAEPRFDIDFAYGRQAEIQISDLLTQSAAGNDQIEVKRKRFLDLNFYVETHCDKGRRGMFQPSGINVTTAGVWAFVIDETGVSVLIPTEELRAMLDDPSSKDREERDGSCPTRGKLISLAVLLLRRKQKAARVTSAVAPAPDVAAAPRSFVMTREQTEEFCKHLVKADEIRWAPFSAPLVRPKKPEVA